MEGPVMAHRPGKAERIRHARAQLMQQARQQRLCYEQIASELAGYAKVRKLVIRTASL